MIGIIGAMPRETDHLIRQIHDADEAVLCGIRYVRGTLQGVPVVAAQCGIGKVYAALCAALMIERYQPSLLLNIGVAGALAEEMDIADIVVADSAVEHDMDTSPLGDPPGMISGPNIVHMPVDPTATDRLAAAADRLGMRFFRAAIATGDRFIERLEEKRAIAARFAAAACDMEGGAIAQVAMTVGTPYAAYRAISDTLMGNGLEYQQNADRAADASWRLLSTFLTDIKEHPYGL